ncbi:MAG: HIT domain-containing protein [Spirochaetia bacterium]|nr:HIT domain-containing protein [Spirochaetia bacterium]
MNDCIFCKIIKKEINADIVKDETDWMCFQDINPKAPVHLLIIPKTHYDNLHSVNDDLIIVKLMNGVKTIVKELGLEKKGYRVIVNTGDDGGQTVSHLHLHILAKRPLGWPPG